MVISLGPAGSEPGVRISADPETIQSGEPVTLTWDAVRADTGFIEPGVGSVLPSDAIVVYPEHTTTYAITVTGDGGSAGAEVTVTVTGDPEPQPENSFGEQYDDLIPDDAVVEEYDVKRFSMITGLVQDQAGGPIGGVTITMHGHPEYGTVSTDAEGRFFPSG